MAKLGRDKKGFFKFHLLSLFFYFICVYARQPYSLSALVWLQKIFICSDHNLKGFCHRIFFFGMLFSLKSYEKKSFTIYIWKYFFIKSYSTLNMPFCIPPSFALRVCLHFFVLHDYKKLKKMSINMIKLTSNLT